MERIDFGSLRPPNIANVARPLPCRQCSPVLAVVFCRAVQLWPPITIQSPPPLAPREATCLQGEAAAATAEGSRDRAGQSETTGCHVVEQEIGHVISCDEIGLEEDPALRDETPGDIERPRVGVGRDREGLGLWVMD